MNVDELIGRYGSVFRVGESLPEDTYEAKNGMVAAIINDAIPEGVFILIKDHTVVEIVDLRKEVTIDRPKIIEIDFKTRQIDAIGISEHDFNINNERLTATQH